MKKVLSIVLVLVMALTFVGCKTVEKDKQDQYFDAEVLEIHEGNILVKPIGGKDIPSASEIIVSTSIHGSNKLPEMEVGMQIRIMFGGQVTETEPAKIDIVFAIYTLDEINTN